MAKQKAMYKLQGSIGDVTFFRTGDGYFAREKSGISAERIASDPKFQRTRENGQEFGAICRSGKQLRDSIKPLLAIIKDRKKVPRLIKLMAQVKNLDMISPRGKRNVGSGIATPEGQALIKGYNFNSSALLGTILTHPYSVNTSTGEITIANLEPGQHISAPAEATHTLIRGCWTRIDFGTGESETFYTNEEVIALDATASTVVLSPSGTHSGTGTDIYLLSVSFLQEMNGSLYALRNQSFNAVAIAEVV